MGSIGPLEVLLVVLVILLLFGSTKLPKLARSMGEASKEFKKGVNEPGDEPADRPAVKEQPPAAPSTDSVSYNDSVPSNDSVTMSRADLDALLAERDTRARKDAPPPA